MFDLSWTELLFVAVLAIILVGPQDMPKLFRIVGRVVTKAQRSYRDLLGGVNQLEKEIDMASGKINDPEPWRALMPEHLRQLPDDFIPGSMTASEHQQRRSEHQDFIEAQKNSIKTQEDTFKEENSVKVGTAKEEAPIDSTNKKPQSLA